ncbi:MAG: sugar phosphate isomerase/epimerase [Bacteroidales bacterium]|nr:sugar phosphate isomerase/epimerase [Bacteroidales bacterium]
MKTIFPVLYTFALAAGLVSCGKHTQKISIFSDHIGVIAQQEGISFADAAAKVKSLGYDAADVWTFSDDKTLKTLDSLGFEHSCAIGYINFFDDGRSIPFGRDLQQNTEDLCLDFCARHGYKNLMIVPWGRGNSTLPDAEVLQRMSSFISRANAQGVDVLFEDNDQMTAYVHSGADLEKVFDAIPSAGHAFDTGNYLANSEDALEAYAKFRDRIRHVHLKDRYSPENMASCASLTGCIPMEKLVLDLEKSGYRGYYVVEIFDSAHMLSDVEVSIRNLRSLFAGEGVPSVEKKDIGLQLYSVQELESNFEGALERIAGMGYKSVEISNYAPGQKLFGYTPEEFRQVIESHGLKLKSSNTMGAGIDIAHPQQCLEAWKQVFADHKAMGCQYLALVGVFIWGDEAMAKQICQLLDQVGALGREYGIEFLYHNHNMEFHPLQGAGLAPIDYMLQHTNPAYVNFELDVYWTMQGKRDPVQMIRDNPDRIHVLHIKDYYVLGASGKMDYEAIFEAFYEAGHSDYFVEMEPESSIEEADQRAGFMYNLSEIMARRPDVLQQAPPAPAEPVDPALVLDKSLKDIAQSCSFILSAPYVK